MRHYVITLVGMTLLACVACTQHLMTDTVYREKVENQFAKRQILAAGRTEQLFSVFDKPLSIEQREALEFLYAYMPLSDLADYDGDFFLRQVDGALQARKFFHWGKTIPEDVFRHFVLVYRVNNENLDTARAAFFNDLKDRVKDLSMGDAALEVNHWCHEHVNYRGTDIRTSGPLALVRTSWGRCGEESTFTVTAMRAVGIPARQCYTPRWAHTDDNHAWVEVWIDGKWHFLGACEPSPALDMGWFDGAATRAMMVHTNVFGLYDGPEEKNLETPLYSKINLLANHADVRNVNVKVLDKDGKPVEGAKVQYKLYNYAELYPIADGLSDANGAASVITGLGELVVWASKDGVYGYTKLTTNNNDVTVTLNRTEGAAYDELYELTPPKGRPLPKRDFSKELLAAEKRKGEREDSMLNAYRHTFMTEEKSNAFAAEIKSDPSQTWKFLQLAQGNWRDIQSFIRANVANPYLWNFLASLSEKDLRDTPAAYLSEFLNDKTTAAVDSKLDNEFAAKYVLSPRINNELIRPWLTFLQKEGFAADKGLTGAAIVAKLKERVTLSDENYYNCPLSPRGVYELKVTDKSSRDICFVAMCRAAGVPARLEPATYKPQYFENNAWTDAGFEAAQPLSTMQGSVTLNNAKTNTVQPKYETHFTLARFSNGDFKTLDYWNDPALRSFPCTLKLDTGYYRLMIGSRASDGSVMVSTDYFTLKTNQEVTENIVLPQAEAVKTDVLAKLDNMDVEIALTDKTTTTLKAIAKGKGVVVCFIDPDKEPSKHVLQDMPAVKAEMESWGGGLLFITPSDKVSASFKPSAFGNLPKQSVWAIDQNRKLLNNVTALLQLTFGDNFPLTMLLTDKGEIVYLSEGYKIGIGENILKVTKSLQP